MALTLDQRRAMKQSLAEGDVQGAQELWQGMQDELTRFVGQPRMVTQPRAASKALVEPTSPIGAAKPRWKSDDLLRLPARCAAPTRACRSHYRALLRVPAAHSRARGGAWRALTDRTRRASSRGRRCRVVSGVNEPMQRYPLPRKHTLREGAVAHLGGGTPAAISPSIHAEAGKMAIERRVESEGPQPEATSSALALASDLGWTVGSRLGQSGSPTAASTRSRSESFFAETQSSPLLLTGPAGGHGGRAGGGGSGRTSPTGGGEEGGAGSRPGSRERRRSHTRKSLSTASRTHGTNTTGASGASSRRSRHAAPPVVLKPTRREIATGMALPVPQAKFDLDSVVVEVERVELPPPEPSNAGTLRADASYSSSAAQSTTADWGMAGLDSDAAAADAAEEMLRSLREQQVRFEKEQRYMEADAARRRFEQVFADEVTRRQDVLSSRQHAQRLGAEEAYELEWRQLRALWDAKIGAFDEKVRGAGRAPGAHARREPSPPARAHAPRAPHASAPARRRARARPLG